MTKYILRKIVKWEPVYVPGWGETAEVILECGHEKLIKADRRRLITLNYTQAQCKECVEGEKK